MRPIRSRLISPLARLLATICGAVLLAACTATGPADAPAAATICTDPRPQVCTMDYTPVCATRHRGDCGGTPCDALETATYANACVACADPKVLFHLPNACSE